ncbi:MAG: protein translocase subunit SecF [Caldisericia bacterium]|nr:protein translocase subunit SecF [Caldisericia bacterium]
MLPVRKWNIIGYRKTSLRIALILFLCSVVIMTVRNSTNGSPFNLGVDFTGGVVMNIDFMTEEPVSVATVREVLSGFNQDGAVIQQDKNHPEHYMIRMTEITNHQQDEIFDALQEQIGSINPDTRQTDFIGPTIGSELRKNALLTLSLALLLILLYVAIRFKFKDGVSAIIALIHDMSVALGVVSLFWIQLNTSSIAALLSITAYSLQDSIVILDRVRENLKYYKDKLTYAEIANMSITTTWIRSFNTSVTTLIGVLALAFFMGSSLRDFTTILLVGLLAGTYSSLYIVVPMLVNWQKENERVIRPVYLNALEAGTTTTDIKTKKYSSKNKDEVIVANDLSDTVKKTSTTKKKNNKKRRR